MECDDKTDLEKEIQTLSHDDICEITLSTLRTLLASDKLLDDLPADVTIEEVNSQIAVAQGQSITVQILRNSEGSINVVIPQASCTVYDLKKAVQRSFELKQQRSKSRNKISWHYIWKTYLLKNDDYTSSDENDDQSLGSLMYHDSNLVSSHGVQNKSKIRFIKRLRNTDYSRLGRRHREAYEHRRDSRRQSDKRRRSRDRSRER